MPVAIMQSTEDTEIGEEVVFVVDTLDNAIDRARELLPEILNMGDEVAHVSSSVAFYNVDETQFSFEPSYDGTTLERTYGSGAVTRIVDDLEEAGLSATPDQTRDVHVIINQTEPTGPCSCCGQSDWSAPHELVGGMEENPGVWGNSLSHPLINFPQETHTLICDNCGAYRLIRYPEITGEDRRELAVVEDSDPDIFSLCWVHGIPVYRSHERQISEIFCYLGAEIFGSNWVNKFAEALNVSSQTVYAWWSHAEDDDAPDARSPDSEHIEPVIRLTSQQYPELENLVSMCKRTNH